MKIGNNSLHIILQNYTSTITELFLLIFFAIFSVQYLLQILQSI